MQSSESSQANVGDMRALFQELSIRLKDTFHLTKEQKVRFQPTPAPTLANMLCTSLTDISSATLPGTDLQTFENGIQVSPFRC